MPRNFWSADSRTGNWILMRASWRASSRKWDIRRTHELVLDARGGRDDRYGLYGVYKTKKKADIHREPYIR